MGADAVVISTVPQLVETVHYWRPDGLPGIEILYETRSQRLCRYFFEAYTFAAALDIHASARYRVQSYTLMSGAVHLGEPGEMYATVRQFRPCTIQVLRIEPAFMQDYIQAEGQARLPHFRASHIEDGVCFAALSQLQHSLAQGDSLLVQQTILHQVLRLILNRYAEFQLPTQRLGLPRSALDRVRDYIHAHWNEPIALSDLAQLVGYSPCHLVDIFRHRFGMPPHAYQIQLQLTHAQQALSRGNPIARVAHEAGFADQAHLTRRFRRAFGLTPGEYRKNRKIVQGADLEIG